MDKRNFLIIAILNGIVMYVKGINHPPKFLMESGQTEIVLRIKEGPETPVGTLLYVLRGFDADGDPLNFGVRPPDDDIIRVESTSSEQTANVYLNRELDREQRDEYLLVLTLTDGRLGSGTFITQSLLILVEDINDNAPVFTVYKPVITLREDTKPGLVITSLEAKDVDEGPFGQVVYQLQEIDNRNLKPDFSVTTVNGKALIRLINHLDYERQTVHQLKVLAVDRAKHGTINSGTAAILIKVQDVEDQPPEFVKFPTVLKVLEGTPIGTPLFQVSAIDGDRGINNPIKYQLSTERGLFKIDNRTGTVYTINTIDREAFLHGASTLILEITATELNNGSLLPAPSTTTDITVIITDLNDEVPTFRSDLYECEIAENAPLNTPLTFLNHSIPEVYDFDQGSNGTFQLYLKGPHFDMFEVIPTKVVNEATFTIKVKNSTYLDYEVLQRFNLSLVAKEVTKYKPKFSEVPVTIFIRDRNDNQPEFLRSFYQVSMPENCLIGTTVVAIQAIDEDSGIFGTAGIRYTYLSGGSLASVLHLNRTSGTVTVLSNDVKIWDRDKQTSRHYLTVEARDNDGTGNRNTVQIVIDIEDVNDNPPIFVRQHYEVRAIETKYEFEQNLQVEAHDSDQPDTDNSRIRYSLHSNSDYHKNFTINPVSGLIRIRSPLDYEALPSSSNVINLKVRAEDYGDPHLSSEVPLTIYVQDYNDCAPQFQQLFYNISVPETNASGSRLVQVQALDLDGTAPNNHVVYRIQTGALDKFVINPENGWITIARGATLDPDLAVPKRVHYQLVVLALDGGEHQLQAAVTVNITVIDVNNKSPMLGAIPTSRVMENSPIGTKIIKLTAKDLDTNARLSYGLHSDCVLMKNGRFNTSNCHQLFNIDKMSGLITIAANLDREIMNSIQITVFVEDVASINGPQIDTAKLTLEIVDENDNTPQFQKPLYNFRVIENAVDGTVIGTVLADDLDQNNTLTYTFDPLNQTDLLRLNPQNGDLYVNGKIDRESCEWINITIRVTDSGQPQSLWSTTRIRIEVLDENDNNPVLSNEPDMILVPEDVEIGTKIGTIQGSDADSGEFGHITYILDTAQAKGKFSLDPETGDLITVDSLDREQISSYLLLIEAWDNYQYGFRTFGSRNTFKHLNVTVLDVNDNVPELTVPTVNCVNISEFHDPEQVITRIHASDADDPKTSNGQLIIDIADGNVANLFYLEPVSEWSADLKVTSDLRNFGISNFTLKLRAQDLGTPDSHLVEKPLTICVTDVNDHAPHFVNPPQNSTLRVPENATIGSPLIKFEAVDEDSGQNAVLRYRLKADPAGHFNTFHLNSTTGILQLRMSLNRSKQRIYDIRIEAYDLGTPTSLSTDLDLTVYITSSTKYRPQFPIDGIILNFTEHTIIPHYQLPNVIERDALDLDGPPPVVCYFIVAGNENNLFQVDPENHTLMVMKELDREQFNGHNLEIFATENCSQFQLSNHTESSLLHVKIVIEDINDNSPEFIERIFTGGISTTSMFGSTFMHIKASDRDHGKNAELTYYQMEPVHLSSRSEGLEHLQKPELFVVNRTSGGIQLNFDPQYGMKGYFRFGVLVNDSGGLWDQAEVIIYLLRDDQKVRFVLRQQPMELRETIDRFRSIFTNITDSIVNIDEFRVHATVDGTIDKTRTDLYLHLVNRRDNTIMDVDQVLKLIDQNTERLDALFKEFNVLDTQPGRKSVALKIAFGTSANLTFWLGTTSLFLLLLLILSLGLCLNQRQSYQRKLKAATATAYLHSDLEVIGNGTNGRIVPNTNKHSLQGSNPVWLRAYENEWYKNTTDDLSQASDSLDENVIRGDGDGPASLEQHQSNKQNVYQTLPSSQKRLETTEL